jgi:hypothetical protein
MVSSVVVLAMPAMPVVRANSVWSADMLDLLLEKDHNKSVEIACALSFFAFHTQGNPTLCQKNI